MSLITSEEVLLYAFPGNTCLTPDDIAPARVLIASERFIRPAFGEALYGRMEGEALGPFVERYIKPALAYYVRHAMIPELAVAVAPEGIGRQTKLETKQESSANRSDNLTRDATSNDTTERTSTGDRLVTGSLTRKVKDQMTEKQTTALAGLREVSDSKTTTVVGAGTESQLNMFTEQVNGATETISERNLTIEKSENDKTTLSGSSTQNSTDDSQRDTTQTRTADTTDATTTSTVSTEVQASTAAKSGKTTEAKKVEDSGLRTVSERRFQAATELEWRRLAQEALADARTLLGRAVGYVESHREEFPDYCPAPGLSATGGRRVLGGLVL